MNFKNIFKREKKVIIIVVAVLTLVVIGGSYALFLKVSNNKENQTVTAGSLLIEYSSGNTIKPSDDENSCLQPQSDESGAGTGGCEFTLSITNKGSLPSQYNLLIYDNAADLPEGGALLNHSAIRHSLKKNNPSDSSVDKNKTITEAKALSELPKQDGKEVLESSTINPGETIEFTLHIWIDESSSFNIVNQYVYLKLDVTGTVYEDDVATVSLTSTLGSNGLNELILDSDKPEYRFTTKDSKNYVKFNNEMWRILGIYNIDNESHIKLVKDTGIEKAWDENNGINFDTSTLKSYLNEDYYNSLNDTAKAQISNTTYHLSGSTMLNINSKEMYKQESNSGEVLKMNVGLMSISDYVFASGINDDSLLDTIAQLNASNWLYTGKDEWLITKGDQVFAIGNDGNIINDNTNQVKLVRPTVYLADNVKLVSGAGTIDSPYELSK